MSLTTSGRVSVRMSLLPCRSRRVAAQPLAAEARLVEPVLLDHRAHRAVEHHDALTRQALQPLDALAALALIDGLERVGGGGETRTLGALALTVGARRRRAVLGMRAAAHAHTPLPGTD